MQPHRLPGNEDQSLSPTSKGRTQVRSGGSLSGRRFAETRSEPSRGCRPFRRSGSGGASPESGTRRSQEERVQGLRGSGSTEPAVDLVHQRLHPVVKSL